MGTKVSLNSEQAQILRRTLAVLYTEQLATCPNEYLRYHSSQQAIVARVNSFLAYQSFLPASGRVLDWGCQHAPDAAMVSTLKTRKLTLIGCDFPTPVTYDRFWNYARLEFVPLEHHINLPFDDESFDCVIGAGALEHTAMDYRSLEELFRILKPNGRLIITHLPNRFSYTEFLARHLTKRNFHRRLYTVSGIGAMLKHNGFYPLSVRRHRFLPTNTLRSTARLLSPLEPLFERVWPLRLLCGDIIVIAERVNMM